MRNVAAAAQGAHAGPGRDPRFETEAGDGDDRRPVCFAFPPGDALLCFNLRRSQGV